jgi:hypothetical protein
MELESWRCVCPVTWAGRPFTEQACWRYGQIASESTTTHVEALRTVHCLTRRKPSTKSGLYHIEPHCGDKLR